MSRMTVRFGSCVVRLSMMLVFFFGNHTSILAQPAVSSPSSGMRGVVSEGSEPVVPPLRGNKFFGSAFTDVIQPLDGLECVGCVFRNVTFEYSGGAYWLENCSFEGSMRFVFKGAAANTLGMLDIVQALTSPKPPSGPIPNPAPRIIPIQNIVKGDFISPK